MQQLLVEAVDEWLKKQGEGLFGMSALGTTPDHRLDQADRHSVSSIVKERVRLLARLRGKTEEEATELVVRFSGHSMRAGMRRQPP